MKCGGSGFVIPDPSQQIGECCPGCEDCQPEEQANMNVDDILDSEVPTDFSQYDRLDMIFMRQHELMKKYLPIERRNGLLICEDVPVNIDDRFGQARLKDFFWRITEELTEAVDACRVHGHIPNHAYEELADSLHFMVEALILSGIPSSSIMIGRYDCSSQLIEPDTTDKLFAIYSTPVEWHDQRQTNAKLENYIYEAVHAIGCASNCLKQRPWKQTHQLTDLDKYKNWVVLGLVWIIKTFRYLKVPPEDIFAMYWKKSEVNKFRQRSNY